MSRYIDADKFGLYLNDIALTVAPTERDEGTKRLILQVRYETLQAIMEDLDRQPTADVRENVKSEWIKDENGEVACTNCGCYLEDWAQIFYNFCPNCGADMRGDKDGENQSDM